jgi:membrane protease YdiL (CAAX protease family)
VSRLRLISIKAREVDLDSQPDLVTPADTPPSRSRFRAIFIGPSGIRAGWRFLIFALLIVAFQFVVQVLVRRIPPLFHIFNDARKGTLTPAFDLTFESMNIATVFLAAFIMSKIERRSFSCYGIPLRGAFGKLFWQGVVWGLALESIEILLMSALGGFSFGGLAIFGLAILRFGLLWALGFLLVGIAEEFTFRGYPQFTLTTGMGFWPSAILLSALFGLVHLGNPGEGWVGALSVMLFGLFSCFTLKRTGNLWFAIGLHAASDFAETFIYSVPDSGMLATGHLINSSLHGPKWLTGGSIGPEGSVLDFALFLLSFLLFARLYPAKPAYPNAIQSQ